MKGITLYVHLSAEAATGLVTKAPSCNREGETLREWLIRSFNATHTDYLFNPTLFGTAIKAERETPLLLEALAQVQNATPEALIESWLLQPHARQDDAAPSAPNNEVALTEAARGKLAQIIDLGETLFERMVADTRQRLGENYSEGETVMKTSAELFQSLRVLTGLNCR